MACFSSFPHLPTQLHSVSGHLCPTWHEDLFFTEVVLAPHPLLGSDPVTLRLLTELGMSWPLAVGKVGGRLLLQSLQLFFKCFFEPLASACHWLPEAHFPKAKEELCRKSTRMFLFFLSNPNSVLPTQVASAFLTCDSSFPSRDHGD